MEITNVAILNFKGLRDVEIPASRFVCVIGENNSGKSSLLQALLLFVEGRKIDSSMFFDPSLPVSITIRLEAISNEDLEFITNGEHRARVAQILVNRAISLVRKYDTQGASKLRWISRVPQDSRFDEDHIEALLRAQKPGQVFVDVLCADFPELQGQVDSKTNQSKARELIRNLEKLIPDELKTDREMDLPSGIDNSIRPLLPEPIYIPAVKDLADEIATKDSASFGKLLGILLNQIAPELEVTAETFNNLRRLLNKIPENDGTQSDNRLLAVKNMEKLVQDHVRENFPTVNLDIRVPPPEIKTVLSGAQIWVDDGVSGMIETKGDGLKRAVTFSILRSFVELKRSQKSSNTTSHYLFLFEEPELYLHPIAQKILFDALAEISRTNHVFVSTHSPLFFGPDATGTFIILRKHSDPTAAPKPYSVPKSIDLSDLNNKDRFQIISYETNTHAFFCKTVVLVEGDTEILLMPHIARILNPDWESELRGVAFCRIGGKGNIARYREFFRMCGVRVCVIADLDCLLDGFEHLNANEECKNARDRLIMTLDAVAAEENIQGKLSSREIRDIQSSNHKKEQFQALMDKISQFKAGTAIEEEVAGLKEQFFEPIMTNKRRQVLEESVRENVLTGR
jgi:putative ATP-dependent endonuclease of OLD family